VAISVEPTVWPRKPVATGGTLTVLMLLVFR
jgi:hypothetical protein